MSHRGGRLALRALVFAAGALPFVALAWPSAAAPLSYALSSVCHRIPERTLSIDGVAMLVCSRCAGLYAGVMVGALLPMPAWLSARLRGTLIVVACLAIAEVALQDLHLVPLSHARRLATGFLLGWAPAAAMTRALRSSDAAPAPAKIA